MIRKNISIAVTVALAALTFTACSADPEIEYKVVGGISEPTRVWNEVEEAPTEEVTVEENEEYVPDVLPMEPTKFLTNKEASTYTSDKDGEVVETLEEGTELTLIGTTGKGYYQTEDGAFISASDVEKVIVENSEGEDLETTAESNAQPKTNNTQPESNNTQPQQNNTQPESNNTQPESNNTPSSDHNYEYTAPSGLTLEEQEQLIDDLGGFG